MESGFVWMEIIGLQQHQRRVFLSVSARILDFSTITAGIEANKSFNHAALVVSLVEKTARAVRHSVLEKNRFDPRTISRIQ